MKRWGVLLGILAILGVAAAGYVGFRTVRPVTAQTLGHGGADERGGVGEEIGFGHGSFRVGRRTSD